MNEEVPISVPLFCFYNEPYIIQNRLLVVFNDTYNPIL